MYELVVEQLQYDLDFYKNQRLKDNTGYLKQLEDAIKLLQSNEVGE